MNGASGGASVRHSRGSTEVVWCTGGAFVRGRGRLGTMVNMSLIVGLSIAMGSEKATAVFWWPVSVPRGCGESNTRSNVWLYVAITRTEGGMKHSQGCSLVPVCQRD